MSETHTQSRYDFNLCVYLICVFNVFRYKLTSLTSLWFGAGMEVKKESHDDLQVAAGEPQI